MENMRRHGTAGRATTCVSGSRCDGLITPCSNSSDRTATCRIQHDGKMCAFTWITVIGFKRVRGNWLCVSKTTAGGWGSSERRRWTFVSHNKNNREEKKHQKGILEQKWRRALQSKINSIKVHKWVMTEEVRNSKKEKLKLSNVCRSFCSYTKVVTLSHITEN